MPLVRGTNRSGWHVRTRRRRGRLRFLWLVPGRAAVAAWLPRCEVVEHVARVFAITVMPLSATRLIHVSDISRGWLICASVIGLQIPARTLAAAGVRRWTTRTRNALKHVATQCATQCMQHVATGATLVGCSASPALAD